MHFKFNFKKFDCESNMIYTYLRKVSPLANRCYFVMLLRYM